MNDFGYEPWARSAVERGVELSPEMGAELLASLDKARDELEKLRDEVAVAKVGVDGVALRAKDARNGSLLEHETEDYERGWLAATHYIYGVST